MGFGSESSELRFERRESRWAAHVIKGLTRHPRLHFAARNQLGIDFFLERTLLAARQARQNVLSQYDYAGVDVVEPSRLSLSIGRNHMIRAYAQVSRQSASGHVPTRNSRPFIRHDHRRAIRRVKIADEILVVDRQVGIAVHQDEPILEL